MIMKYRLLLILSGAVVCLSGATIMANSHDTIAADPSYESMTRGFDHGLVSFDDEDDYQDMNEFFDTVATDHISRAINPVDIMIIFNLFGIPEILELPFFLRTNFLNKRTLLDQPIFEPDRAEYPGTLVTGAALFARKATR